MIQMFNNPQKKFSEIYDKYVEKIYRFIFLKVNSQEIAQDLCSEVFTRGWKKYKEAQNPKPKAKNPIENPQAFLYQIARNLVIDFYRTKSRTKTVSLDSQEMSDPRQDLENSVLVRSDIERIKAALANLPDDYQNVIIWHYLDELSISEIAKIMKRPEGTVRVMLHRGLKELRRRLS